MVKGITFVKLTPPPYPTPLFFSRDIFLPVTFPLFENCHGHLSMSRAICFKIVMTRCHGQLMHFEKMLRANFSFHGQLQQISKMSQELSMIVTGICVNIWGTILIWLAVTNNLVLLYFSSFLSSACSVVYTNFCSEEILRKLLCHIFQMNFEFYPNIYKTRNLDQKC